MPDALSADLALVAPLIKEFLYWLALPAIVAVGSAALVWMLMQARMQLLAANYQAALAKAEKECAENRPGFEELLAELRVERRRFLRKISGPHGSDATILTLERLYFRQLPLTGWMQEEIPLGHGEELPEQTFLVQELRDESNGAGTVSLVPR